MYFAYRRTSEAIALLEQVRERQLMILGNHHPSTLVTLLSLGDAYLDAGEPGKALPLYQQAAVGVEKHEYALVDASRMVDHLALCHEQLKQYDQAEVWRRKSVAVLNVKYGPESVEYAGAEGLESLGSNLLQQKKYTAAEPILRESLAVLQKKEPKVWETFRTRSRFGGALLGQQKYGEAEQHLVQGYEGMKALEKVRGTRTWHSSAQQDLSEALERLVQLYDAWDKPVEAAKWRKELEALRNSVS
jgi:tetratricopeptide (TPR) repeat protein